MKKLVFMVAAVVAMSFAVSFSSCDGANGADSTKADSSEVVVDTPEVTEPVEEKVDSNNIDTPTVDAPVEEVPAV